MHDTQASHGQTPRPSWHGLFLVQSLGVLNDNFVKSLILFIAIKWVAPEMKDWMITAVTAIFNAPFVLFSPFAGWLSRVYLKQTVVRWAKASEILIITLAVAAFAWQQIVLAGIVVFLMGLHSTLYGPSKYSLISDIGGHKGLTYGNGMMEMLSFTSVVVGTLLAGLVGASSSLLPTMIWVGYTLAIAGWLASLRIRAQEPEVEQNVPVDWNPIGYVRKSWAQASQYRGLNLAIMGASAFWMIGQLVIALLARHCPDVLHMSVLQTSITTAVLAVGIGLGCIGSSVFARGRIELAFVPLGGAGLATGLTVLALVPLGATGFTVVLGLAAFMGGFYKVPLGAWIQGRLRGRAVGPLLAYLNMVNFIGMFLASGLYRIGAWIAPLLGWPSSQGALLVAAFWAWTITLLAMWKLPNVSARLFARILMRALFRLRVHGEEVVPTYNGALLVCNHVSLLDALLVQAASPRGVRFVMIRNLWATPLANWFFKTMGVIPVAPGSLRSVAEFVKNCRTALENGQVVCLFAEGQVSRTGNLQEFQRGLEVVLRDLDVPVIPLCMDGVFGAPFSFPGGRLELPSLSNWRKHVVMRFGKPMKHPQAWEVRQAVQELMAECFADRLPPTMTLAGEFLRISRRHGNRMLMQDSTGAKLTRRQALLKAASLAALWRERFEPGERVGVLLPSTVAGAMMNLSLTLAGRIPVNLNYTSSREAMDTAKAKAGIRTVLTSQTFLTRLGLEPQPDMLMAETLPGLIRKRHKLWGVCMGLLAPRRLALRHLAAGPTPRRDDIATIVFSSGSTGVPKGVPLTHGNILADLEGIRRIYRFLDDDVMVGILPFFHAYGFTGTLWLPVLDHISVGYHPNPTEAQAVGDLIAACKGTILIGTPTFLENYLRRNSREKLGTLRHIISGAEKLRTPLRKLWHEMQGRPIREGYGATECSPIIAVNCPDWEGLDFAGNPASQKGTEDLAVGLPIPGVVVRIVDRDDLSRELPPGEEGMLLVKGAIVMKGYLDDPEATGKAFHEDWYITGDIARLDPSGFLHITDRLSRFSKIGGEMVPHLRVEDELQRLSGREDHAFAVVGLPHPAKGEQLAVVTTLSKDELSALFDRLSHESTLPALWRPKPNLFLYLESLPVLPTGKTDILSLRRYAREHLLHPEKASS
jgi:acyl-[acyl-carrier-protein]-phospholipid O-acyltransferase / long-chain-fatty-acid--[acyl-carrier-protein] ligase